MTKLTDEQKQMIGKPQFHNSIFYAYNPRTHCFMFYTPVQGREMVPIGMFSPLATEEIPYDPQEIVEIIADTMSRSDTLYDFDLSDDESGPDKLTT